MKNPLISVLMPVYNAERYLDESISSILKQTYRNFELIILNDASTDSSDKIIRAYKKEDERIKYLSNKKNLYIASSRNKLLSLAKGKYIAWQDADDISTPDRLEQQITFLEKNPKVGIVGGYLQFIDENGNIGSVRKYDQNDSELRKKIFKFSPVAQPVAMIRKKCLDEFGGYNLEYPPAEDLDMSFRIGTKYQFANIPHVLLKYREHLNSATFSKLKKMELKTLKIRNIYARNKLYNLNLSDILYNCAHFLSIYIIPAGLKIKIFNLIRNTK